MSGPEIVENTLLMRMEMQYTGGLKATPPEYFKRLFNQDSYWITFPRLVVNKKLTQLAKNWLIREVIDQEIKKADFTYIQKTNWFNACFLQKNRHLVGGDVISSVKHFFKYGRLLRKANHTYITLVSKITNASYLSNFRLISCCKVIKKFIPEALE